MRIVSLVPGATDSLIALGAGDELVAVTHECEVDDATMARVTRSHLALDALDGGAIESAVNRAVEAGAELYEVDWAAIRALEPDLVVAQDVCEVCAVPGAGVEEHLSGVRVLRQHPHSLADVLDGIDELGAASGHDARPLLERLRDRIHTAAGIAARHPRVRTVFLEWLDPPYPAGHWTPDLLELAGLDDALARPGLPSVAITWEQVRAAAPDLLVIAPCGFAAERAAGEARRMQEEVRAVGAERVVTLDGARYFNRPGPGLVDSLEILVETATELRPARPR